MLQSPAKRRRVTETQAVSVNASNTNTTSKSQPATPTRASYASPTKASLARSHPNILARSPARRSGGRNLRDEILGARSATQKAAHTLPPDNVGQGTASQPPVESRGDDETGRRGSFYEAVTKAFSTPREPLSARQGPAARTDIAVRESTIDNLPVFIEPKLVEKPTQPLPAPRLRSYEPDLPPTVVQLGLEPAPEKPRGLASSSSPRGSKSGSGRRRTRIRGGSTTSSPLKPKANAQNALAQDEHDTIPSGQDEPAEEAPESEAEHEDEPTTVEAEELKQKAAVKARLQDQLRHVKEDMEKLESATNSGDNLKLDTELLRLLTTSNPSCAPETVRNRITQKRRSELSEADRLKFLRLFSPGDMQVKSTTSTKTIKNQIHTIHDIAVRAPPPFSNKYGGFGIALTISLNNEANSIHSNKPPLSKAANRHLYDCVHRDHPKLCNWINERLQPTSFHRHDIGTIVWATGEYFVEAQRRAKEFIALKRRLNKDDDAVQTKLALERDMLEHITKHHYEIDIPDDGSPHNTMLRVTEDGRALKRKLRLNWTIDLDWTGTATSKVSVAATGVPTAAHESIQKIFDIWVGKVGVVEAVERCILALRGNVGIAGDKKDARKRKADAVEVDVEGEREGDGDGGNGEDETF